MINCDITFTKKTGILMSWCKCGLKKGVFHVLKSIKSKSFVFKTHFSWYLLRNIDLIWVYMYLCKYLFLVTVLFEFKKKYQLWKKWKPYFFIINNYRGIGVLQHRTTPRLLSPCVQLYLCTTNRVMLHRPRNRHTTHHCREGLWEDSSIHLDLSV